MAPPAPVRLLLGDRDPIVGADQLAGFPGSDVVRILGAGHFDLIYLHTRSARGRQPQQPGGL